MIRSRLDSGVAGKPMGLVDAAPAEKELPSSILKGSEPRIGSAVPDLWGWTGAAKAISKKDGAARPKNFFIFNCKGQNAAFVCRIIPTFARETQADRGPRPLVLNIL